MKKFFGSNLRKLRGSMTQTEMAGIFGVKQNTYSQWENDYKEPSISTIRAICSHFGVSADWLLGLSDDRHGGGHVVHASGSAVAIGGNANAINGAAANCADCPLMQAAAKMAAATKNKRPRNA